MTGQQDAIKAAMSVAKDVAEGRVLPAGLEATAVAECRELFARVAGAGDPLWPLHVEVARQVLAVGGGIPADELAEWTAVTQAAEGEVSAGSGSGSSWIEQALADGADEESEES